ncbi:amino acid adenylation domain-containing protein [Abyssisolibacter fermentans]|uniref:amino acid adenylation domain-containing protein n=1 Tax=Abyssisolibacter fermentans TaxID=1766203 RepID=UPI00082B0277|nr:non-ribosomal peptide synthetase [Abyssisolibacter fermentans]
MTQLEKIDKNNIEDILSLTPMQEGMLFHYLKEKNTDEYFEQLCLVISGLVEYEIFKKAWEYVTQSNEMLRTIYKWDKLKKPVQLVLKQVNINIINYDLSTERDKDIKINEIKQRDRKKSFNLAEVPFRITLIKIDNDRYQMIISNHHILYDGWSTGIILREFFNTYDKIKNQEYIAKTTKNKFKHFIKHIQSIDSKVQEKYWKNYLSDLDNTTYISTITNKQNKFELGKIQYKFPQNIEQDINKFIRENNITLAALLYTAWGIILQRYTNNDDVIFGSTVSGRNTRIDDIENIVGLFINTLPMRITANDSTALDVLKETNKYIYEREEYETTSLVDIEKYSNLDGKLFNSIVVVENYPLDSFLKENSSSLKIDSYSMFERTNYDLTLGIEVFNGININILYNKASFSEFCINNIAENYKCAINSIIKNKLSKINDIDIVNDKDKQKLLCEFNNQSYHEYDKEKTIYEMFEQQAVLNTDNTALVFEDIKISYGQLNAKSNQLARLLRNKGVKENTIVGIMTERSIEMIIAVLAVLKAGGAYLPIDPQYPKDRIKYMIDDTKLEIVLKQSLITFENDDKIQVINVDNQQVYSGNDTNLNKINRSDDLAYVIYTSGSTGKPKGVMVEHKSITSAIMWRKDEYKLNEDDAVLQLFSYVFDGFLTSFFTPIVSGAKVILVNEKTAKNPTAIKEEIIANKVTHFIAVPTLYSAILEVSQSQDLKSLRTITLAGEAVTSKLVKMSKNLNKGIEIINEYGPTEASVVATMANDVEADSITIGKPVANKKIYILNKYNKLQPTIVEGELCIGGDGLARCYLNRDELTECKFIENPYVKGERIYKTGDAAKFLSDGTIKLTGRIDEQVKLRGFRIELGEIENKLLDIPNIRQAVVMVRKLDNNKHLCAYVVTNSELDIQDIKDKLSQELPKYMIPSGFIKLDKIPVLNSGKVNKKALAELEVEIETGYEYVAPSSELEIKLVNIYKSVLEADSKIGIKDDFFEIGGHSLSATNLVSKIHKELDFQIPLKELFNNPTVQKLALYIESTEKKEYQSIKPASKRSYYPLSSVQKRMYVLNQLNKDSINYNMMTVLSLDGKLDVERFNNAFKMIVSRHESLRTSFSVIDGEPVQIIHDELDFNVDYILVNDNNVDDIIKSYIKPFDLSKAPLMKLVLAKVSDEKHLLIINMHHIISDGVSTEILVSEFLKMYDGQKLEDINIQYKDYAVWQQESLLNEESKNQEQYWLDKFKGEIPVLDLMTDYPRPTVQSFEGDDMDFVIDSELTKALKKYSKDSQITMYMILLGAFNILLSKYTWQDDIIVGTPIAARHNEQLSNVIGMFANTIVMRNNPVGNMTIEKFFLSVKENCLNAYANQDYQFEDLVEKLGINRDTSRNPIFDVMFSMPNIDITEVKIRDIKVNPYEFENKTSKFDILLTVVEGNENVKCNFEYCSKLFKKETIKDLSVHYVNILRAIVNDTSITLDEIDMVSSEEKKEILEVFNDTTLDYPKDITIQELFEQQVRKTPDKVAVVYEDKSLTYRQLNEKANQLAGYLRKLGVKKDQLVGLMAEKSLEMIVALIAIPKAGCAFVGIAPEYPNDRIEYLLEDCKVDILLTHSYLLDRINFENKTVICLEDESIYKGGTHNLENTSTPTDLMYIIYTSGSTGKPKGIMIEQRTIINLLHWEFAKTDIEFNKKVLQFATISFDICYQETYSTLSSGGELYVISNDKKKDVNKLLEYVDVNDIGVIFLPTSYLKFITSEKTYINKLSRKLNHIVPAGEQLIVTEDFKKYLRENNVTLHNHYGPSEAHVVTAYTMKPDKDIEAIPPIGSPLSNTRIYLFDTNSKLVPVGVRGEVCICGNGVARGYLYRPELTEEKFVKSPFNPNEKMYKTGDLARWLPDGNLEYIERIDKQVKIRGYRIEIGEIENILKKHSSIKDALVVAKDNEDMYKYLCAYIVGENDVSVKEIRDYLSSELPEYMIPSYFIKIDSIPLDQNGKVNKKALPEPDGHIETQVKYEAPRNDIEKTILEIMKEVLAIKQKIGINDKFFDLGGHSLKAITFVSKIHQSLNIELPLQEVFRRQSVKEIAGFINQTTKSIYSSIIPVENREYYPLSSAQMRMFILNKYNQANTSYNMPSVLELKGKLDIDKLEHIFKEIVRRHESLRTSFELVDGQPIQKIHEDIDFKIELYMNKGDKINSIINKFIRPFDLSTAPLFRVGIIEAKKDRYLLMLDMHHIVSDGVSTGILVSDFIKLYNNEKLHELKIQYKDYAVWQKEIFNDERMIRQEKYWLDRFSDDVPVLDMVTDYPRPKLQSLEGDYITFKANQNLKNRINKLAKQENATMYMTLLTAYNTLLYKYTHQEDIVVGSPIAGRPHADLENILGMFVNTLAMRNNPTGTKTFRKFLGEVKQNALNAFENQDYQFEELVDKLKLDRDMSRGTLFDTVFSLQNMGINITDLDDIKIEQYEFENKTAKFDFNIDAVENDDDISFRLQYCTKLFKKETMIRFANHFINILYEICDNPEIKLDEIKMISNSEKQDVLSILDNSNVTYPKNKTIHSVFEEQVKNNPNKTAVICGKEKLTYSELNKKANKLAKILRNKGVAKDSIVGIILNRSTDMITAMIAVLKAGGAYLPIDTQYPADRVNFMLEDSDARALIISDEIELENINYSRDVIYINELKNYEVEETNLTDNTLQNDLAYIIYTSGTTGKPKGVMVEHKNVIRLMFNEKNHFDFDENDVWTMFHSYCFDFSVWEMYGALLFGGKLVIVPKETAVNPKEFLELLQSERVTVLNQTPSAFYNLINEDEKHQRMDLAIRYIIFGGEALNPNKLINWKNRYPNTKLINMYGITETTVHVTYKEITDEDIRNGISNIGKPIPTLSAYVMDKNMNILPVGIAGELYVGGDGVARGYINREKLTLEKFVPNPYIPNTIMYRSGDLVRLLDSGDLEYLGRIDKQVKIRGYRIELGEIQSRLQNHEDIKTAVVITRNNSSNEKCICAYIQVEKELTVADLRTYLSAYLPEYMIPAYFVEINEIPLTSNGKINVKALPEPDNSLDTGAKYEEVRNQTDRVLMHIWQDLLGISGDIGINDNFFELGGHSLKATTLSAKIHKSLNVEVPLQQIFASPTIKELSDYIIIANKSRYDAIKPFEKREYYPLSSSQKRMYILNQINSEGTNYNMPSVLEMKGKLDIDRLKNAFNTLIKRHDALRTSFKMIDGKPIQIIDDAMLLDISLIDIKEEQLEDKIKAFIRPFDLTKAPLIRVEVLKIDDEKFFMLTDMHHIISDGVSTVILITEFSRLYNGEALEEIKLQYKDYAVWQNELMKSDDFNNQKNYWLDRFSGEIPLLDMKLDYNRPSVQSFKGDSIDFIIDADYTKKLYMLANENKGTLYMVLLAVYNTLLYKYTGQEDIIVGSPIAGRPHADLQSIIGIFLNTLAFRNYPSGEKTFKEFLSEVKLTALEAYQNQDYQFEELVEVLNIKRDKSRNPLFDTMFNLRNMDEINIKLKDLEISPYKQKLEGTKLDIELAGFERDNELIFTLEYSTDLFKRATMKAFVDDFIRIIDIVINNPDIMLSDIEIISKEEKQDILDDFNEDLEDIF